MRTQRRRSSARTVDADGFVEYALLLLLILITSIPAIGRAGAKIDERLSSISASLSGGTRGTSGDDPCRDQTGPVKECGSDPDLGPTGDP